MLIRQVCGVNCEFLIFANSDSKNKYTEDDIIHARVSSRQHFCGLRGKCFPTDSPHSQWAQIVFGGFHRTLQRVRLANRGLLLLRTSCPVPFETCICSNVGTIHSWTCQVYGPFEFRTSGTSIFLNFKFKKQNRSQLQLQRISFAQNKVSGGYQNFYFKGRSKFLLKGIVYFRFDSALWLL